MERLKKCNHNVWVKAKLIARIPWASQLDRKQVVTLARYTECYEAEPGQTVLSEGSKDGPLLLVVSGQVEIVKSATEREKTLARLGPGNSLGEMLIDGRPRSASAIAATLVLLLSMSRENFIRLDRDQPTLGAALLFKFADSLSQNLRHATEALVERL